MSNSSILSCWPIQKEPIFGSIVIVHGEIFNWKNIIFYKMSVMLTEFTVIISAEFTVIFFTEFTVILFLEFTVILFFAEFTVVFFTGF
jgi:hypothetical protein